MNTTNQRVRRLEQRIARLETAGRVPDEARAAYARVAATQPVSPAEQARHRAELLAAVYGTTNQGG